LDDRSILDQLLTIVIEFETLSNRQADYLRKLSAASLAAVLISGVVPELPQPILPPLPNHIFTRDIGVSINGGFLTCIAGKTARKRETILTWFVAHYHPLFSNFGQERSAVFQSRDRIQNPGSRQQMPIKRVLSKKGSQQTVFIDLCKDSQDLLDTLSDSRLAIEGGDC